MNYLDPVANFITATVSATFAADATSLTLTTGGKASLPNPGSVGAYNLVLFNSTDYVAPHLDASREIVRYTTQGSGEVINITRAQESTTAIASTTGKTYTLWLALTAKTITDIDTTLALKAPIASPTFTTQIISPIVYGSSSANGGLIIKGTSNGTKTTSYVTLQADGGTVGIGTTAPSANLQINKSGGTVPSLDGGTALHINAAGSSGNYGSMSIAAGTAGVASYFLGDSASERQGGMQYNNSTDSLSLLANVATALTILSGGNVGIGTTSQAAKLAINGGVNVGGDTDPGDNNLYVVGDCSALTFTDRTSGYEGNALVAIKAIKNKAGKIDHSTFPEFMKSTYVEDGETKTGRNIGNTVSVLTKAIQELLDRVEVLEHK